MMTAHELAAYLRLHYITFLRLLKTEYADMPRTTIPTKPIHIYIGGKPITYSRKQAFFNRHDVVLYLQAKFN